MVVETSPRPVLPGSETFAAIQRQSATSAAIAQIKRLVASGTLRPGQRLPSERALSELLQVSRPTVREAVSALVAMGVLESRHGNGTYVTALSPELLAEPFLFVLDINRQSMLELFQIRLALEVRAAEVAAPEINAQALASLDREVQELTDNLDDIEAFVDADIAFHQVIHCATHNGLLLALMRGVSTLDRQVRIITSQERAAREGTVPAHQRILDALRERDPQAAADAMSSHLKICWAALPDDATNE